MDRTEHQIRRSSVGRRGRGRPRKQPNKNLNSQPASGMCNLCSAPCSSCMHHNQTASVIESNTEGGSSEESCVANSVVQRACKGNLSNDQQHTGNEVSNLHSTSSSHDSYSENTESKANARVPDLKSEGVNMPPKQSCLVEGGKGEVLGKMLDDVIDVKQSVSLNQGEVPIRQTDYTNAVSLHDNNTPEKLAAAADELATGGTHGKGNSSLSDSLCITAQNSIKNEENDIGRETDNNTSGKLSSHLNQQTEGADNLPKEPDDRADNENDESDILDDDVKVCDICGDVGREELLAICTRCSDGAEHTYCMRIMLDKLPEGDWLCEECKIKDDCKKKIKGKSEDSKDLSKASLPNLDSKSPATMLANKGTQNSHSNCKPSSVSTGIIIEPNARTDKVADPDGPSSRIMDGSKTSLVGEASSKITGSKIMCGDTTSRSQNLPVPSSVAHALPPNSLKVQPRHPSPRGFSSASSINSPKSKVDLKPKTKLVSDSSVIDAKKWNQTIGRSTSFRSQSTSFSSSDSIGTKTHSINRVDAQTLSKQKGTMERKNSLTSDKSQSNLPLPVPANVAPLKVDQRGARPEGRVEKASINRATEDAHGSVGTSEKRKLPCTPKAVGILSLSGQPSCKDQKMASSIQKEKEDTSLSSIAGNKACDVAIQHGSSQSERGAAQVGKNKEINYPRPPPLSSGKIVRCQRCNEMGHLTQFCSVDKFRLSAMKPSSDRIPKDGNKTEKWRSAVEMAISKTRLHRNNGLPGLPSDFSSSSNGQSRETSSKSVHSNLKFPGRSSSSMDGSKSATSRDMQQRVATQMDGSPACSESGSISNSGGQQSKAIMQKFLPEKAIQHPTTSCVSAIPELEYIWQGCFEVQRNESSDKCTGVQAHLSSFASPKVVDVASKFPGIIQLEEASCVSAWPPQFCEKSPMEENIALFFFATDIESYEKSYKRLLENMLMNDSILKGNLDGVELLIFPSNKLPEKSQRWNRLFFLWGVFRVNRSESPAPSDSLQKKLCEDSLNSQSFARDSQQPLNVEASEKFVVKSSGHIDSEISASRQRDNSENGPCNAENSSSDLNPLGLNELPSDKLSRVNTIVEMAACSEDDSAQQIITCSKRLFRETKDERVCEQKATPNLNRENVGSGNFQTGGVDVGRCEDIGTVSLQESDDLPQSHSLVSRGNLGEGKKVEANMKSETNSISSQVTKTQTSGCDPRPDFKCPCPSSQETAGQASTPAVGMTPREEQAHTTQGDVRQSKRIKLDTDDHCLNSSGGNADNRLSSKIHPVQGGLSHEAREGSPKCHEKILPECSTSSQRSEVLFFPVNCEVQQSSFISHHVASSAGEDFMEAGSPNLDLALGATKQPREKNHMDGEEVLVQSFLPLAGIGSKEVKPPDPPADSVEDGSSSLSLSLAFPFPEERQAPERSEVPSERARRTDTPLLLFGSRFADS